MEIESFLPLASSKLSLQIDGAPKFGFDKRSAGCRCLINDREVWLKIKNQKTTDSKTNNIWTGEVDSRVVNGVNKPVLFDYLDWEDEEFCWRATVSSYIREEVWSSTPFLTRRIQLGGSWLPSIKDSLQNLQKIQTDRMNIKQDLIDRRLKEHFGDRIDSKIENWVTCHGDLHWANLTVESPVLLDWEAWGSGPQGLDPAILIAFSVDQPELVQSIEKVFDEELSSSDGIKAQLFFLVELIRMCDLHGKLFHPRFEEFKKSLVERSKKVLERVTAS